MPAAALSGVQLALEVDKHGFTRRNIAHEFKAQSIKGYAFRCDQIFRAASSFAHTDDQRTNTVNIAKRQQTVTCNDRDHRISPLTTLMHTGYGIKNSRGIQTQSLGFRLQFMSQHVQQHFRIGIGIDVAQVLHEQLFFQFFCIGQIAVVSQHDAER